MLSHVLRARSKMVITFGQDNQPASAPEPPDYINHCFLSNTQNTTGKVKFGWKSSSARYDFSLTYLAYWPSSEMCTSDFFFKLQKYGIEYLQDNNEMARKSDVIFACLKPNVILSVLNEIAKELNNKLIISVAAGITLTQIQEVVPESTRVVRIMPNTPCLVQAGTAVFSRGSTVTDEDIAMTSGLCSSIFNVFEEIPESLISAASGISGCGPAYNDVCSPGGATIAAVHALEQGGVRPGKSMNAVQAGRSSP
ncbi:Pyrroline-5-carboxylate reductase [Fasciola gigantica]|uniref:Pyrroline-5-carboxylate reductase n=1 Tax=Fasciola gigantica TaxID=46835 RepID=A0A504YSI7_FASGI|nr:Pyrroline-5-carboxylate reductase [Fasciola gigantica]